MVIGKGMIARRFESYKADNRFLLFASGVSNSVTTDPDAFDRESRLLQDAIQHNPDKTLIYFSTCSIYDPSMQQSVYVKHKIRMEEQIEASCKNYLIFRVSNPIGKTINPHTVLNFFIRHIQEGEAFTVWKYASRNLIDLDDMFMICDHILEHRIFQNRIVNIANPVNYPVSSIIEAIEKHLNTRGRYDLIEKGNSPLIDTTAIQSLFTKLGIDFNSLYLSNILKKYFPKP